MNISAVILAGGQSRRMGCDKAFLEVNGQTLIARAVQTIRAAGIDHIAISGRPAIDYASPGCSILLDREPQQGPIAGIERALHAACAPLVLVMAVDMPFMRAPLLRALMTACAPNRGVVPRRAGELEPLAAIYPRRCHAVAVEFLQTARRSARDFASECVKAGALDEVPVAANDEICFANWNEPSDRAAAPEPARRNG